MGTSRVKNRKAPMSKRGALAFYILMAAIPLTQFGIFYFGVNINSIFLAFKDYDSISGKYSFAGFSNFIAVIESFSKGSLLRTSITNSLKAYAVHLFVSLPFAIIFSFYLYKKMFLSRAFNVMLCLPSFLPSILMVIMFRYFVEYNIPEIFSKVGLTVGAPLSNSTTIFPTVIFYNVWIGFGVSVILYSGAMTNLPQEVSDATRLENINLIQELWYIVIPQIFPTISTFLIMGVAGIFTNQINLVSFFGYKADNNCYTLGYYIFTKSTSSEARLVNYPIISSLGIMMSCIMIPITLGVKSFLEKVSPLAD